MSAGTLVIGTDGEDLRALADALGADVLALPKPASPSDESWSWAAELEAWRTEYSSGPMLGRIVAAVWPVPRTARSGIPAGVSSC